MRLLTFLFLLAVSTLQAADPIEVELTIDPVGTKYRYIKCSVVNRSKRTVEASEGCDGIRNLLLSRTSHPIVMQPVYEMEFEKVRIPPGEKRLVFEILLEDALLLNGSADYRWKWHKEAPRGVPPISPVRGAKGTKEKSGVLRAEIQISGKPVASPEVTFSLQ